MRHEINIDRLMEENEKIALDNQEKEFQKFVAFYWQRKAMEKDMRKRIKSNNNKLLQRNERLIELEKMKEKKRNELIRKIKKMDLRKQISDRNKYEKVMNYKTIREKRFCSCAAKKRDLELEESERRKDILLYQNVVLGRSLSRDNIFSVKKCNASERTLNEQMMLERNLALFQKKMNELKSQSIIKKSPQERYKIFKEFKRKEAERKKELEDEIKYNNKV